MSTQCRIEILPAAQQPTYEALTKLIQDQVMLTLGRVTDLLSVQVRRLWEASYRVNVLVGPHAGSARVAHSFFVVIDKEGKIIESTPRLPFTTDRGRPRPIPA